MKYLCRQLSTFMCPDFHMHDIFDSTSAHVCDTLLCLLISICMFPKLFLITLFEFLQMQLYTRFIEAHPQCSIQHRSFIYLRPFFVIKCKERNVYCCRYHIQVMYLLEALNAFRDPRKGAHVLFLCNCTCIVCDRDDNGVCSTAKSRYAGVTVLWESLLCLKAEDEEFHKKKCLLGSCSRCGAKFFDVCPRERVVDATRTIQWKQFEYEVVGRSADGEPKKRIKEVHISGSFREFLEFFVPTVQHFIRHNFIARWQSNEAKILKASL